jgi:hypothetical protein
MNTAFDVISLVLDSLDKTRLNGVMDKIIDLLMLKHKQTVGDIEAFVDNCLEFYRVYPPSQRCAFCYHESLPCESECK